MKTKDRCLIRKRFFYETEHEARRDAALKKHLDSRAHYLPRFILIQAQDLEQPITKLSPFVIQKAVAGVVGTVKSVRKMYRPYLYLLMEVFSDSQSKIATGLKQLGNVSALASDDTPLNRSKGVIRTRELDDIDEDEIVDELRSQGVIAAKRMVIKRSEQTIRTGTYVLTFGLANVPSKIRLGNTVVNMDVFIPNPLRF